jgi:hypothetical protein
MKKNFITALVFLFIIGLTACSLNKPVETPVPTYTPYPTYTLLPTYTAIPTHTPSPTRIVGTVTPVYRPITWSELTQFLADDHTNWHEYVTGVYNCVNFAIDLVANAKKQKIDAWIVTVDFSGSDTGHAFVGFNTTDKGVVWIEPQSDYAYSEVKVGQRLCKVVDTDNCWDLGTVTMVVSPAYCDARSHDCW